MCSLFALPANTYDFSHIKRLMESRTDQLTERCLLKQNILDFIQLEINELESQCSTIEPGTYRKLMMKLCSLKKQ